jgi:hypothetical protein
VPAICDLFIIGLRRVLGDDLAEHLSHGGEHVAVRRDVGAILGERRFREEAGVGLDVGLVVCGIG